MKCLTPSDCQQQLISFVLLAIPESLLRRLLSPAVAPSLPIQAPRSPVSGVVTLPGSKSIANRALLLAALGAGKRLAHLSLERQ